jgi:hypothetical protein
VPAFDALPVLASPTNSVDALSVNLADHDQDGDLDLALAFGQVEIRLFVNDGTGAYSPGAILSTDLPPAGAEPRIRFMAFEDLDDDGNVDLLGGPDDTDHPRIVLAFRGLGGGSFEAARAYGGGGIMGPPADLDGDGDLDLSGISIVRALRFDGPEHGRIRQYGEGTAGTGGTAPVIGAKGPLRVGVEDAALRLRGARGGAQFALFHSLSAGTGPAVPYPGAPTLLGEPIFQDVYTADGAPGVPGAGTFDLDLGPMLIDLVGVTVYFQAGVVDPEAADGFALSNGLELTFGL